MKTSPGRESTDPPRAHDVTARHRVRRGLATLRRADVLGPRPARSVAGLAMCALRHGGSLFTLAEWVESRTPERIAIVDSAEAVSFAELVDRSLRRRDEIEQARSGSRRPRVVLLGRNSVAYVEWVLACGRAGADLVLLNTAMPVEQLAAVCRGRRPDLVICDIEFDEAARASGIPVRHIDVPVHRTTMRTACRPHVGRRRRRKATITMLTSGTTGPSSLVSQRPTPIALARVSLALIERLGVRSGQSTLLTVPLLHGHGLATLALSLAMGSPLHLVASTRGPDLLHHIDDADIAVAVVVPTILERLLDASGTGRLRPTGLHAIVCGSAPLDPVAAITALDTFGPVLFNLYGTSESGLISLATPTDLRIAPTSVGRVLPGVRVRIVESDGSDVAVGEMGRVVVSCGQVPDGFDTGDLGHLDEAGMLFLHGRSDDLIVRGGENFFPSMIEERIKREVDAIAECAVIAEPDASEFGSSLHLFVVVSPQCDRNEASLLDELARRLPRAIRPTIVTIVDTLPRNQSGEVVRRLLGRRPGGG